MAVNLGEAIAYLELDTSGFTAALSGAGASLKAFGDDNAGLDTKLGALEQALSGLGSAFTEYITRPLLEMASSAINTGMEFDAQMSRVGAISGATSEEVEMLRQAAIQMGADSVFGASDAAKAMEYMGMAGWNAQQMIDGLPGIMNLAAASGEDLGTVSDIVTDALTAFGLSAKDSAHFADVLATATTGSNTTVGLLGESFKYVAPLAGAMGYTVEDVTVALGLMANAGIKGSQSGTALRSVLTRLAKPTDEVATAMDQYGIAITNTDGTMKPLSEVMDNLRDVFGNLTEAEQIQLAATLAGQEGMSGLLAIVNASEEDYQNLTDAVNDCEGATKSMASAMLDNLKGDMEGLQGALETLAITFSDWITPAIRGVIQWVTGLIDWLNGLDEGTRNMIFTIASVVAAIGPVLLTIAKVIKAAQAIGSVMNWLSSGPTGLIIAAIAAVVAGLIWLWNNNEDFRDWVIDAWTHICEFFQSAGEWICGVWESICDFFSGAGEWFQGVFGGAAEAVQGAWEGVCGFFGDIWDGICQIFQPVIDFFTGIFSGGAEGATGGWDGVLGFFSGIWDSICGVFSNVSGWFQDAFSGIGEKLGEWFGAIGSWAGDRWTDICDAFNSGDVAQWFSDAFSGIGEKLGEWFGAIGSWAGDRWTDICDAFNSGDVAQWFSDTFSGIGEKLGEWFGDGQSLIDVWNGIQSSAETICQNISSAWESIKTGVADAWQAIRQTAGDIWEQTKQVASDAGQAIADGYNWACEQVGGAMDAAGQYISDGWESTCQTVSGWFGWTAEEAQSQGEEISEGLAGGMTNGGGAGRDPVDTAKQIAEDTSGALTDGLSADDASSTAQSWLGGSTLGMGLQAVLMTLAAAAAALGSNTALSTGLSESNGQDIGEKYMAAATGAINTGAPTMASAAGNAATGAHEALTGAMSAQNGSTAGGDYIGGASGGISGAASDIAGAAGDAADGARDALASGLSAAQGAAIGRGIMSGLVAGINAGKSGVISAMRAAAQAAVAAAKAALDIHSPSRVFREIGRMIPEGMAEGIADARAAAVGETISMAEAEAQAARAATGKGAGGGNEIVQNITVQSPKALSAYEVARQIRATNRELALQW